ncbi:MULTISPECIES: ABC transporter substrate-binding protein [unclassified Microbacterium]|uniref:ABC transporter substrate-binding protein n=1 Tax=unclassified Microbacterium TaxID=2609290 RepID=UPI00214C8C96|nr:MULTISPECIES: ABC transporter substrate-binding protein [unclassified Microbacterium]MCR2783538.1 ABC transporter substrate-binding protein [Microbacterium sp. zg.B96]WIM15601.1 ABC transporter substrate-binding protein [Microbacterium sp. zg-B96]
MTRAKSLRVAGLALAAAAAVVLAGCSAGESGEDAEEAPQEDRTLRLALSAPPSNFSIGAWSGGDATLFLSVYDTVFHRNLDGSLSGGIAEEWEYNDDSTQLTLTIRDGVEFTNGEVLDAQAVVAALDVARAGASTAANLASVTDIEATDESTVVISLARPDASLIPILSGVSGAIGAPEVLTAESSQLEPVGSGAYTLSDESTAGATYILEKNEDFYDAESYPFSTVEMQVIADSTAAQNAMKAGQLHVTGLSNKDQFAQFPADQFTTGVSLPGTLGALWLVDREGVVVPALADARVRQAINLAFDREAIATGLGSGYLHPTAQVFSPSGAAFHEDLTATYDLDVEEAKNLLTEAGYPDGFAVTMPSTVMSTQFESAIGQALADIGITVTWESVPFQDFYAKVLGGSYGMFFMFNGFSGSDAGDANASLAGVFNPFGSTTDELEALLAEANASGDEAAFGAVNEYLVEQAWFAPMVYITPLYVVSNDIDYTPPVVANQNVLPFAPAE